jgi:hypothetical protein
MEKVSAMEKVSVCYHLGNDSEVEGTYYFEDCFF